MKIGGFLKKNKNEKEKPVFGRSFYDDIVYIFKDIYDHNRSEEDSTPENPDKNPVKNGAD